MYNTLCRWHFYAGLFCIPFILLLSATGGIYLFKPQIESWLDQPYDHLDVRGIPKSAEAQVNAAVATVPGSALNSFELPLSSDSAVRVLVGSGTELFRVYVHPVTLAILEVKREDSRLMRFIFHLHGELLLGDKGSMVVEFAASWTIVLILTGLYLWWPRNRRGLAGILYPRLGRSPAVFWRDLHAVTGLWISCFVLLILISGLPWAKSWGSMLKEVRHLSSSAPVSQDWTTGSSSELAERKKMNTHVQGEMSGMPGMSEHANHGAMPEMSHDRQDYSALDRLIITVTPLGLAPPVLISPPSAKSPDWTARSDAQNRPLRVNLVLDARTAEIKSRRDFSDSPLLDRIIGVGVALHEGQLFGWINQLLGLLTALGLELMVIGAVILWWRRRPTGTLGAPTANGHSPRLTVALISVICLLGVLLPLLGLSLIVICVTERLLLRRIPALSKFLGLRGPDRAVVDSTGSSLE